MERHIAFREAIIALDRHQLVSVLRRHRHLRNLVIKPRLKVLGVANRFSTQGARDIGLRKILIALTMHGVTAAQKTRSHARVLHVFEANNAVLLEALIHASMVITHIDAQTATTIVAMEKVLASTDSADAAFFTVKDLLLIAFVVIQGADLAVIFRKILMAANASLGFGLFCLATKAFNMRHLMSI